MTNDVTVLTADFPKSVRGYSPIAVDDFVREIGARLESLEKQLQEKSSAAEELNKKLQTANNLLAAASAKENAIAGALVAIEQRRVTVEQELEYDRSHSAKLAEQAIAEAQADAEKLTADAEKSAARLLEETRQTRESEEARVSQLRAEYQEIANRIRRALEAQLELLPAPGELFGGLAFDDTLAVTSHLGPASRSANEKVAQAA